MSLVVLDTDVASASIRRRLSPRLQARLAGHIAGITFVTLGELTKWTAIRDWGPRRLSDLDQWQAGVLVLPYDRMVCRTWGLLQARAQKRGRPRPQNDTWIAACCLVNDVPLATFNLKDFSDFAEHEGLCLVDVS